MANYFHLCNPHEILAEVEELLSISQTGCALQMNDTDIIGPPQADGPILKSGTDPLVSVAPNATDVYYVAASALMGVIGNGCGAPSTPCQGSCPPGVPCSLR